MHDALPNLLTLPVKGISVGTVTVHVLRVPWSHAMLPCLRRFPHNRALFVSFLCIKATFRHHPADATNVV